MAVRKVEAVLKQRDLLFRGAGFIFTEMGYGVAFAIRKNTYLNPAMKIVIASETKQSRFFQGDCHAPIRCSQ
jgi:hypothetical protein